MTGIPRGAWVAPMAVLCALGCSSNGDDDGPNGPPTVTAATGGAVIGAPGGTGVVPGPTGGTSPSTGGVSGSITTGGGGGSAPMTAGAGGSTPGTAGSVAMAGSGGGGPVVMEGPPAPANSWAMMGGDARNTYFNASEKTLSVANAANLKELWRFQTSGYPPGSPTVVNGKVYVMATGATYGIDLITGKPDWTRMDINGTASLAYENGFLYAHTIDAKLYKLKASDGTTVWGPVKTYDFVAADGTSSPIVGGGKVIVGHSAGVAEVADAVNAPQAHGGVFAADTKTGMEAWHYWTTGSSTTPENGAMVWSSVTIHDGVVYAATGNNYTVGGANSDAIHAIDLATGMKKWVKQVRMGDTWTLTLGGSEDTDFGANPIIADVGGKKIVAAGDKASAFWALDRDTGNVLWSRTDLSPSHFAANGGVLMNGAFDGEAFYVISNDPTGRKAMLHKMNPSDGKDMWPFKTFPKVTWGAPSLANGLLVVPVDNELVILDAATSNELKRFDTGGTIAAGAAAIVDGKIVVKSGLEYALAILTPVTSNTDVICYGLQ